MPRNTHPKHHPQRGGNDKRGRHKKASSSDVQRRIKGFERIDWRGIEGEGKAA